MTRTQLYLPESQYRELKQLAMANGKTFAGLAREFLQEKIKEAKSQKKTNRQKNPVAEMLKSLKVIESLKEDGTIRDMSVRHDYYLYTREGQKELQRRWKAVKK